MATELIPVKLVVVGDGYVGKTTILGSYAKDEFKDDYRPTIFDNSCVIVKVGKKMVSLGLWDTAGQEEYSSLRPLAYSHCDIFLIVFSVLDATSFENARTKWFRELERCVPETLKIFVGNKIDLRDPKNSDHISYEKASKILSGLGVKYYECSALTREGIEEVFLSALKLVLEKKKIKSKVKVNEETCCSCF